MTLNSLQPGRPLINVVNVCPEIAVGLVRHAALPAKGTKNQRSESTVIQVVTLPSVAKPSLVGNNQSSTYMLGVPPRLNWSTAPSLMKARKGEASPITTKNTIFSAFSITYLSEAASFQISCHDQPGWD
jgi:hypothetical protein